MSFGRANPLGWALYEILSSTQMNQLDIDHANAIDGAGGGTYAPSAPIVFDGDVEWAEPRYPMLESRVLTRVQGLHFLAGSNKAGVPGGGTAAPHPWNCGDWNFIWTMGGVVTIDSYYVGVTPGVDDPAELWLECPNLIDQATITGYGIWCRPGPGAGLPDFMPSIALFRLNCSTGWAAPIAPGEREDQSATNAAFRTYHTIETANGAVSEYVDQTMYPHYRFYMRVHGESGGGNAQANFQVIQPYINFTVTKVTPG